MKHGIRIESNWLPWIFLVLAVLCARAFSQTAPQPPRILASLPTLQDGIIKGTGFGEKKGKVYIVGRFDMTLLCKSDDNAARSQWMQFYDCKPKGTEQEVPADAIQSWTKTAVTLAWPKDKKLSFTKQLRQNEQNGSIGEEWPLASTEYLVELPDGTRSALK